MGEYLINSTRERFRTIDRAKWKPLAPRSPQWCVWVHVEWTAKATAQIQAKEYRFLSPVFSYQKSDTCIIELTSAGLTNQPNLNLTALNRAEDQSAMSLLNALRMALDLSGTPDEDQIVAEVETLKMALATARNRAETLPLDKFIPRVDYDAALSRATNVEQNFAEIEKSGKHRPLTP